MKNYHCALDCRYTRIARSPTNRGYFEKLPDLQTRIFFLTELFSISVLCHSTSSWRSSSSDIESRFIIKQKQCVLPHFDITWKLPHFFCTKKHKKLSTMCSSFKVFFSQIRFEALTFLIHFYFGSFAFTFSCHALPYLPLSFFYFQGRNLNHTI